MSARLSVVVVTFDSAAAVARCLPGLAAQLEEDDELVVVDNGSTDGTLAAVRTAAPRARLLAHERNLGFAAGANAGAAAATGDVLLFLNPDAAPAPGFVEAIRRPALDARGWAAWMGLVTMDAATRINTSGGVIHFTGIAWAGRARQPIAAAPAGAAEVAFLSGACLVTPRATWERLGGFPPAFFMYGEDVDLSLRLRLGGGRLGIEPAARVDHDYAFDGGAAKWRRLERNRWAVLLRDYPGGLLALIAPALLATELALLAIAAGGGWLPAKLRASADTFTALPRLLRERRAVQATRAIPVREFARWLTPELDSAYLGRAATFAPLRFALRAYWRIVLVALDATGGGDRTGSRDCT